MAETCCLADLFSSHGTAASDAGGTAFANGGSQAMSCATTGAGTVKSCGVFGCSTNVTITAGTDGLKATINWPQVALWNRQWGGSVTCQAKSRAGGGGSGGGCTPNPNNANVPTVGDVGFAIITDPAPTDPPPCTVSPILIDLDGHGFHLTDAENGVMFDISGTNHPVQMGWTAIGAQNAFLALPGADGLVHNGKELFGNFTPQQQSPHPNGFLALAEYDKPEHGGNGDGVIDDKDAVFSQLRLWIDENHDGISQPNELHALEEFGVRSISLSYFESRRTDEWGNQFRYKARVNPRKEHRDQRDETTTGEPGRWTYDVFFVTK
jgi:hypothetical protein